MILVDFNQVMISNVMMESKGKGSIDENMCRHMLLNSLRSYRNKFKSEYGELVIAADNTNIWRKKIFPYYKANRKKSIDQSDFDWQALYDTLNKLRSELKEFFPYKFIHVESAEADDVIGVLTHEYGTDLNIGEKILIISSDEDYFQLHTYSNVFQYDPVFKKRLIKPKTDPSKVLHEHILFGCTGDGIPNVLSADNCLVLGIRQKSMTKPRVEYFMNTEISKYTEEQRRNYQRNQTLIDLSFVPIEIKQNIIDSFNKPANDRSKLMNYFISNKLKLLMTSLQDF